MHYVEQGKGLRWRCCWLYRVMNHPIKHVYFVLMCPWRIIKTGTSLGILCWFWFVLCYVSLIPQPYIISLVSGFSKYSEAPLLSPRGTLLLTIVTVYDFTVLTVYDFTFMTAPLFRASITVIKMWSCNNNDGQKTDRQLMAINKKMVTLHVGLCAQSPLYLLLIPFNSPPPLLQLI